MTSKRILVFGVTGTDKRNALDNFAAWASTNKSREYLKFDFEKDFLFNPHNGGKAQHAFLGASLEEQHRTWGTLWGRFRTTIEGAAKTNPNLDLLISVHGCLTRGHFGVRTLLQPTKVAELKPDRIVTLMDNVYDMWWRTERRAGGLPHRGRPTLEHLVWARRFELAVADQVAYYGSPPTPNLFLSVAHPCETLWNWIYAENPRVVYLAFPISAPRELGKDGDLSGIAEVNSFLKAAYDREREKSDLALICPLGIDELPLLQAQRDETTICTVTEGNEDVQALRFDRDRLQWNLESVWESRPRLVKGGAAPEDRIPIPLAQLQVAGGIIRSDVGWRDYRLVDQAKCLAVFNPKFKNRTAVSRSLRSEMTYAATRDRPVFVYQDPSHDPKNVLDTFFPRPGTMGVSPTEYLVVRCLSLQELLNSVEQA